MVYSLAYRRPAHVSRSATSHAGSEKRRPSLDGSLRSNTSSIPGIPDALSFDRVISGGTCPPVTTRDFMNYLVYIEHSAENLQFYLWYRDFVKRFAALPPSERALAPEWVPDKTDAEPTPAPPLSSKHSAAAAAIFQGTDFDQSRSGQPDLGTAPPTFHTPPRTPAGARDEAILPAYRWDADRATEISTDRSTVHQQAASAFEAADVKLQPFTVQPFREEVARIIATYISEDGPRQLNLASKERTGLLRALAATTHPSAFLDVSHTIEWSLRHQAHPNFVRWSICNGNRPRVVFARGLGVTGILAGLTSATLLTVSRSERAWRALSAIGFIIGIATLIAAWKGMCVVLHGLHHRHLRPWELFADDDDVSSTYESKKGSFDSFGTGNSYEDEPWVAKYERRNLIRKVCDREVWIQDPALRDIQDTIFLQALFGAVGITIILLAIFLSLPKGNKF